LYKYLLKKQERNLFFSPTQDYVPVLIHGHICRGHVHWKKETCFFHLLKMMHRWFFFWSLIVFFKEFMLETGTMVHAHFAYDW